MHRDLFLAVGLVLLILPAAAYAKLPKRTADKHAHRKMASPPSPITTAEHSFPPPTYRMGGAVAQAVENDQQQPSGYGVVCVINAVSGGPQARFSPHPPQPCTTHVHSTPSIMHTLVATSDFIAYIMPCHSICCLAARTSHC